MTADEQRSKFIEAARELGADEDSGAFRERLKKLVKAPETPQNTTFPAKKKD